MSEMIEQRRYQTYFSSPHDRPLTIGYLTPQIRDEVGHAIWSGVAEAAQQKQVKLICFVGERLNDPRDFRAQANIVYHLVNLHQLDGLISWTSSLGVYLDAPAQQKFYRAYHPLPLVSLGSLFKNMPSVLAEGYNGMRHLMTHLIEEHGYRRLVFLRGPENHPYAQERYQAYLDALQAYNLPLNPNLITPPRDWTESTGHEMLQLLLDQRQLRPKLDFEAVVTFSDRQAIGALRAMQRRGIQVPEEVGLVGFNDSMEGRAAVPPLTSVAVPFYEQGQQAVELLLKMLAGQPVPQQVVLPARLVVRRSCGCRSQMVLQASAQSHSLSASSQPVGLLQTEIITEMAQSLAVDSDGLFLQWIEQLLTAFEADLSAQKPDAFLLTLEHVLSQIPATGKRIWDWQWALSVMRGRLLPFIEPNRRPLAEDLWQQARVLIGEIARHNQISLRFQVEQQAEILREINLAVAASFDMTKLMDVLAHKLPQLGITGCYLSLYENSGQPADWARLILAYTPTGRLTLEPGGMRFKANELVPLPLHSPQSVQWVAQALYFQEEQLGFMVFEGDVQPGKIYQALCHQISSILKGAALFKQNVELYNQALQAKLAAERANQLKTRLLANVSHELRNPLDIILGYTQLALKAPPTYHAPLPPAALKDLGHIHRNADYLRRVIDDLLDLSRAEIDELELRPELINPQKFLEDVFRDMADHLDWQSQVTWQLQLPPRLPMLLADPTRLRQILLNLLSNARKFTDTGQIILGAEVDPPHLHLWVQDTGSGISPEIQVQIFEPFFTSQSADRNRPGIGLGLSITRRLVALHRGYINVESQPGRGSTFHVYLPLPSLSNQPASTNPSTQPVLWVISGQKQPPPEIVALSQRQGLEIRRVQPPLDPVLTTDPPVALAWDITNPSPEEWRMIQHLHQHPRLRQIPFILYGQDTNGTPPAGLTNLMLKSTHSDTLLGTIQALTPTQATGPILIVDDDPHIRELYENLVGQSLPGYPILTAENGVVAWQLMAQTTPSLVILDLIMPKMDGFEVLRQMRAANHTRHVPVLVLSGQTLTLREVKQLESHTLVTLHSKGILSEVEAAAALHRALFQTDSLPPQTGALVKRTIAYFHQHYDRTLTRQEIAEAVGVSKDYLSDIFRQELGLSPWDYLNRYRILHAKALLNSTNDSITNIALRVGFNDPSYFGRVFHEQVGLSPRAYKKNLLKS
jgi:signal transduction histidine kinase/AraC-like DNA-binding protein